MHGITLSVNKHSPTLPPNHTFVLKHGSEPPDVQGPQTSRGTADTAARRTRPSPQESVASESRSGEELRQDRLMVPSRAGCCRAVCGQLSAMVTEEAAGLQRLGRGPEAGSGPAQIMAIIIPSKVSAT